MHCTEFLFVGGTCGAVMVPNSEYSAMKNSKPRAALTFY